MLEILTVGLIFSLIVFRSGVRLSLRDMWSIVVFSSVSIFGVATVSLFGVMILKYTADILF